MISPEDMPIIIFEVMLAVLFLILALRMFSRKESAYKKAGLGLLLMSLSFLVQALLTALGFFQDATWVLPDSLNIAGAAVITWAITRGYA